MDIANIYNDYCHFNIGDMVDIFAIFLTYMEGEKYIPYRHFGNFSINKGSIIIKETVDKQYDKIDYDTLNNLYKHGDLIILPG